MAFTHTVTLAWQRAGEGISQPLAIVGEGEDNRDITVNAGATNLAVAIVLDAEALLSVFLLSNQEVTLKTNSSGSPVDTLTLKAGKPIVWYPDTGLDNPFSADVTSMFLTNAGAAAASVQMRFLKDATP